MSTAVINLISGINGSGKTLWLLQYIEKNRYVIKDGKQTDKKRPVYYWGIRGIKEAGVLDWQEIAEFDETGNALKLENPALLHEIEQGAIIVVDEAHAVFPRGGRGEPPDHVNQLATSRWRGHTFYLCTQNGADLHTFVRARIGLHVHMVRVWGMERATALQWERFGDASSNKDKSEATKSEFRFPKEVYSWYKSADSHQVERRPPYRKLAMIAILPIASALVLWWGISRLFGDDSHQPEQVAQGQTPEQNITVKVQLDAEEVAEAWSRKFAERLSGHPMSAMFYDQTFAPQTYPRIAGCMEIRTPDRYICECQTQQGTTIDSITHAGCVYYLKNGWFDPGRPDEEFNERDRNGPSPQPIAVANPIAG